MGGRVAYTLLWVSMTWKHRLAAAASLVAADGPAGKKFEPRSEPGAGQAYLSRFAGEWEVTKTFHPRRGCPVVARGRAARRWSRRGGSSSPTSPSTPPAAGRPAARPDRLRARERPVHQRLDRLPADPHVDPPPPRAVRRRAKVVLHGVSLDPDTPDPRPSRTVSALKDDDRTLTHQQFSASIPTAASGSSWSWS